MLCLELKAFVARSRTRRRSSIVTMFGTFRIANGLYHSHDKSRRLAVGVERQNCLLESWRGWSR